MDMNQYYACQLKVSRFGTEGQRIWQNASCLIVGMGGLGCPVGLYLAPSGIGTLGLCDADVVDFSNINRQVLYTVADIGQKKIQVARHRLERQNPYIQIVAHDERLNETNWQRILPAYDLVIDCTDNFHSKYLLHDACLELGKPLVQGGVLQGCGQVYYFPFGSGEKNPPCLRCIWPQSPALKNQTDCSRSGVLPLVVGNVGLQQANLAALQLLGRLRRESVMLLYDWEKLSWQSLTWAQQPGCVCGNAEPLAYLRQSSLELASMAEWQGVVLDVRNVADQSLEIFGGRRALGLCQEGLDDFESYISQLPEHFGADASYLLVCYKGIRSLAMAERMRERGLRAWSLAGGAAAL